MKVLAKIATVLALGSLVSAGLSSVHAICAVPGTTFTCNYFDAPIGQDVDSTKGVFWGIGQFNPAHPGGTDNGIWPSSGWLRYISGAGFYLAGDWSSDAGIDGCVQDPPNPQPARMGAAWCTTNGTDSYFVAMCSGEDVTGTFNTFTDIPGTAMTRTPKPVIQAASRTGNNTNLTVGHEPVVGGVYNTGGCNLTVTGFKIYEQTVPRNAPAPTARAPGAGWTLFGTGTESAAAVSGTVTCTTDGDIYLSTTLVLDGNVELACSSRNSTTRVECGPNLATPNGDDFRIIRKPKSVKGR